VFNFELEMHTLIREKGAISKEEFANASQQAHGKLSWSII
jgi:hypothetical protein